MEKNNSDLRRILKIVFFAVILFWVSNNVSMILGIFSEILAILSPFILGGCIAFIINIPMAAIEKRMLKPRKNKKTGQEKQPNKKLARFFAMLFSIIFIIFVILAVFKLIVPELINVVQLLIEKIPYLAEQAKTFLQTNTEAGELVESIMTSFGLIASSSESSGKRIVNKIVKIRMLENQIFSYNVK